GTWGLGGEAYGPVEEADAERVLRRAIEMGFSLIDTADGYGAGRMERLVGRLLKEHPELVVVTKAGLDRSTDPARKCFEPAYLEDAVARSCKRLGVSSLPLLLLHHPSPDALHHAEAIAALESMKQKGAIL